MLICAGVVIREAFGKSLPDIDGKPCGHFDQVVTTDGSFTGHCRVRNESFDVQAVSTGDLGHDFVVKTTMQSTTDVKRRLVSSLRFRKIQATCPVGWSKADTASPGDRQVVNSLTGAVHGLAAPVAAPAS